MVLALFIMLAAGFQRPMLAPRYFTSLVPLALLGVVLIARRADRAYTAYAAIVVLFLTPYLSLGPIKARLFNRNAFGFEEASGHLMSRHPTQLVFLWDHPAEKILDPRSLRAVGSFFFRREGFHIPTVIVKTAPGEDPNSAVLAAATGERPAVLWLYDVKRRSAASDFPPNLEAVPGWRCQLYKRPGTSGGLKACTKQKTGQNF
jgi:hypothetical protein